MLQIDRAPIRADDRVYLSRSAMHPSVAAGQEYRRQLGRRVGAIVSASRQQFFHHVTVYVRQPEVAAGITIGKILVVEAKQSQ